MHHTRPCRRKKVDEDQDEDSDQGEDQDEDSDQGEAKGEERDGYSILVAVRRCRVKNRIARIMYQFSS